MELNRLELSNVKRTAKIVKPLLKKKEKFLAEVEKLNAQIDILNEEIDLWEKPIVTKYGFTSEEILSGKTEEIKEEGVSEEFNKEEPVEVKFENNPFDRFNN